MRSMPLKFERSTACINLWAILFVAGAAAEFTITSGWPIGTLAVGLFCVHRE